MSESETTSLELGEDREIPGTSSPNGNLDTILRIPVTVQVVLGSAMMPVSNLLKLGRGAVIALDHRVGEPADVVVNGRIIARGEIVVIEEDNSRFGVSLTEIVDPSRIVE
jgi:flagellar motor switch protein FliN